MSSVDAAVRRRRLCAQLLLVNLVRSGGRRALWRLHLHNAQHCRVYVRTAARRFADCSEQSCEPAIAAESVRHASVTDQAISVGDTKLHAAPAAVPAERKQYARTQLVTRAAERVRAHQHA